MEALKAIKIIGNQNDGRAVFFVFQIPGSSKGFKFHALPKTGAYSCLQYGCAPALDWPYLTGL